MSANPKKKMTTVAPVKKQPRMRTVYIGIDFDNEEAYFWVDERDAKYETKFYIKVQIPEQRLESKCIGTIVVPTKE